MLVWQKVEPYSTFQHSTRHSQEDTCTLLCWSCLPIHCLFFHLPQSIL